jgi:hypothetical protein
MSKIEMGRIEVKWILAYIDKLLAYSQALPEDSPIRKATELRAQYLLDMLDSWKAEYTDFDPRKK